MSIPLILFWPFVGPSDLSITKYYRQLFDDVDGKKNAGFNTTITDYWGRALSYQLVDPSDGGPGMMIPPNGYL